MERQAQRLSAPGSTNASPADTPVILVPLALPVKAWYDEGAIVSPCDLTSLTQESSGGMSWLASPIPI